jgi:hypothetical protein
MGYGNVSTSLALARFQLAQQGINHPTPQQLETALMGGTITANGRTVAYQGILQMRADGMGWGEIAHASGTKLGPVVSSIKSQNTHFTTTHPVSGHGHPGIATPYRVPSGSHPDVRASDAHGPAGTRGVVTAAGAAPSASHGHGKAGGQVSTAGGVSSSPRGHGIVTAAGTGASPAAHGVGQGKAGVVTGAGVSTSTSAGAAPGNGNGKALGHTK